MIAHPPCTYLTVTGNRWLSLGCVTPEQAVDRWDKRAKAVAFFLQLALADVPRIAVENPVGYMATVYRKPDQIIQPWQFGDAVEKKTCLWLKGLPKLKPTEIVQPPPRKAFASGKTMPQWYADLWHLPEQERARLRSQTFPGIAAAMAEQWGGLK